MTALLSISQVARMWNIKGSDPNRKVRDLLRAIELKRNLAVLIEKKGRFYTTETMLKNVMPEMFQEDNQTIETIKGLKDVISQMSQKLNTLTVRVAELERQVNISRKQ